MKIQSPISAITTRSKQLQWVLSASPDKLLASMVKNYKADLRHPGTRDRYAYIDRGASVLAVAHIDTVQAAWGNRNVQYKWLAGGVPAIGHPNLDDRLGVFTILHILKAYGINVDILLCDYEEQGMSTAAIFAQDYSSGQIAKDRTWNWLVEFDRAGDDVVVYDYQSSEWRSALQASDMKIGWGSFSDINDLQDLGVCGVNIGVGYHEYHSKKAWFDLTEWSDNLLRFMDFHHKNVNKRFEHTPVTYGSSRYTYSYHDKHEPHPFSYCAICAVNLTSNTRVYTYYNTYSYDKAGEWTKDKGSEVEYMCPSCALEYDVWSEPNFQVAKMYPLSVSKIFEVSKADVMNVLIEMSYDDDEDILD